MFALTLSTPPSLTGALRNACICSILSMAFPPPHPALRHHASYRRLRAALEFLFLFRTDRSDFAAIITPTALGTHGAPSLGNTAAGRYPLHYGLSWAQISAVMKA